MNVQVQIEKIPMIMRRKQRKLIEISTFDIFIYLFVCFFIVGVILSIDDIV